MNSKVWLAISLLLAIILYWQYQAATPQTTQATSSHRHSANHSTNQANSQLGSPNKSTHWADSFRLQAQISQTPAPPPASTQSSLDDDEATEASAIKRCPFAEFTDQEHQLLDSQLTAFFNEGYAVDDIELRKLGYIFSADSGASNHHKRLFFSDYLQDNPNDSIAVHQLLKACLQLPHDKGCGEQLDTLVAQSDNDNGYLWLQLATNKLVQRKPSQFLRYLEIAANKSRFDNYYFNYVDLFLSTSIGRIDIAYTKLRNTADELASAQLNNLSYLVDFCTGNLNKYQDSCLRLAKSLDGNSNNVDLQSFGSGLLKEIYRTLDDDEALAEQTALDQQRYSELYNQDWVNAQSLMQYDQELMVTWLENGKLFGERAAVTALLSEAKLKSLNPDYLPCPLNQ
ncbi:hypothetical protein [Thalassotalea euphylliae]|uniref:Uncharacterized protein n=1 Tax=Thalassotalea euphylliae TaxID=1655234 RepID=A0A3E0UI64_9GAMM|nr:hypothetical protein [Thalassotalea euphylliae]REL36307.1 hypothetical protein DXX92_13830 [Thalassotalea euphylliae]